MNKELEEAVYQNIGLAANEEGVINQALATANVMKVLAERMYSSEEVNLMFATLKANSVDNIATITNVDLFISSWQEQFTKK